MRQDIKQYLKIGLLSLFFSTCLAFFIIVLCIVPNPALAAEGFKNIRFDGMTYASYDLAYRNSDNPAGLHFMMEEAIYAKNNSDIIYYGDRLFNNKNYYVFTRDKDSETLAELYVDGLNSNAGVATTTLISYASLDNYLKNKYIGALLEKGFTLQARDFARAETEKVISNQFEIKRDLPFFYSTFDNNNISPIDLQLLSQYYNKVKTQLKAQTEDAVVHIIGMGADVKLTLQVLNLRLTQCADVLMNANIQNSGNSTLATDKQKAQTAIYELAKDNSTIIRNNVNWF